MNAARKTAEAALKHVTDVATAERVRYRRFVVAANGEHHRHAACVLDGVADAIRATMPPEAEPTPDAWEAVSALRSSGENADNWTITRDVAFLDALAAIDPERTRAAIRDGELRGPVATILASVRAAAQLTTPERLRDAMEFIDRDRAESHGRVPLVTSVVTPAPHMEGATIDAAQIAPLRVHDPEHDRRVTELLIANNREVEARQAAMGIIRQLTSALEEILTYRGGADTVLQDEHVMERARKAFTDGLMHFVGAPGFAATHEHLKSGGLYRLLLLGEREDDLRPVAIYAGENGRVWVRDLWEFNDGRFRRLGGEG